MAKFHSKHHMKKKPQIVQKMRAGEKKSFGTHNTRFFRCFRILFLCFLSLQVIVSDSSIETKLHEWVVESIVLILCLCFITSHIKQKKRSERKALPDIKYDHMKQHVKVFWCVDFDKKKRKQRKNVRNKKKESFRNLFFEPMNCFLLVLDLKKENKMSQTSLTFC